MKKRKHRIHRQPRLLTPRRLGINPRALGINPRALGINQKLIETNPMQFIKNVEAVKAALTEPAGGDSRGNEPR